MREVIDTERLLLRPFVLEDARDVFEYASVERVVEYLTWNVHKSIEESKQIIQTIYIPTNVYCIELKAEHRCIGAFEPRIFDNEYSFGYVLNKNYWNNGYMSEVLKKMIDVFFEDKECENIFGIHFLGNDASGIVMKKCGMKIMGIQKEKVQAKGRIFIPVLYKIERQEWEKQKESKNLNIA